MKRLVSILIPAFNAEATIAKTIESVINQTWATREVIVVDDGSTDRTLAIARRFASQSVAVVSDPNRGAAAARNKAYSMCQGEYIQWLDADDILAPEKIKKQMDAVLAGATPRTLLSSGWARFFHRIDRATVVRTPLWCDLSPVEWLVRKLGDDLYMPQATWLVGRSLADAAGPWDVRLSLDDDGEYFSRVVAASETIRFIPEVMMFYRRNVDSLSSIDCSNSKIESQFLAIRLQSDRLLSLENSERTKAACLKFLNAYAAVFYPDRPDLFEELQELAATLGGKLAPRLSWKYSWIQKMFGWRAAKQMQRRYNKLKTRMLSFLDGARLFERERVQNAHLN